MNTLITALQNPALYDHPVQGFSVRETHISWVLLTGPFAYKIKKPVNFGFLDFSSLQKRRFFCQEEVRLNRRYAPEIYLEVVAITGDRDHPALGGEGEVIEYAVKMRQFSEQGLMNHLAATGGLRSRHIDAIAAVVAASHAAVDVAGPSTDYGDPDHIRHWATQNFAQILPRVSQEKGWAEQLESISGWSDQEWERRRCLMEARKADGFVRECHGDLHLGNMTLIDDRVTPFDCIEFNADIRWIDVISEVAFVAMDLRDRGHPGFSHRFLNQYLRITGDYGGVRLLRYYLVYRALVRAKVAVLQAAEQGPGRHEQGESWREYGQYADLALRYTREVRPALILTVGCSGSGKSALSGDLVESLGAVQLRSDVERKRLAGMPELASSGSGLQQGIYSGKFGELTYERLNRLAAQVLDAGFPLICDAAFLRRSQRRSFLDLAVKLGAPCVILELDAPESVLRERIIRRQRERRDPSEAGLEVLEYQLENREPLEEDEQGLAIMVDATRTPDPADLTRRINERLVYTTCWE